MKPHPLGTHLLPSILILTLLIS